MDLQYVFVLKPGAIQQGNVYADSNNLWAAILAQRAITGDASTILIEVDGSIAPAHWLPNGVQNLSGVKFFTSQQSLQGFTLNVDDGVVWTFDALYIEQLSILSQGGTTPVTIAPGGISFVRMDDECEIASKGASPFFNTSGVLSLLCGGTSTLGDFVHHAVKVTGGAGNFTGFFFDNSAIGSHAFDPTGTSNIGLFIGASVSVGTIDAPLTPTISFLDLASQATYTAAVLANWSGTNPTSVANALDRIAAKVGPIP